MSQPPASSAGSSAASPQFLQTAQSIANLIGLDVERVARGDPMIYKGLTFWLRHGGELDPDGMVLVTKIDDSELSKDDLKSLLRHNFLAPVGVAAHYAMLPDNDDIVRCQRIDLQRVPNPVAMVISHVEVTVACRDHLAETMHAEMRRRVAQPDLA